MILIDVFSLGSPGDAETDDRLIGIQGSGAMRMCRVGEISHDGGMLSLLGRLLVPSHTDPVSLFVPSSSGE